jgi:homoserine O-acetyltransferase/O-succinyltransferase
MSDRRIEALFYGLYMDLDREIKRVKNGRVLLISGSEQTAGHGTTGQARFWKQQLAELLQAAPRKGK